MWQDGRRGCAGECDCDGLSVAKVFFMKEVMLWRHRILSWCRELCCNLIFMLLGGSLENAPFPFVLM